MTIEPERIAIKVIGKSTDLGEGMTIVIYTLRNEILCAQAKIEDIVTYLMLRFPLDTGPKVPEGPGSRWTTAETVVMSRGPGRIEQAIEKAWLAEPSEMFTVAELCDIAYPSEMLRRPTMVNQRRSVLRAAEKVAERRGWERGTLHPGKEYEKATEADLAAGIYFKRRLRRGRATTYQRREAKFAAIRAIARERKGLPALTPEQLEAEREAATARRAERNAKVAKVQAAMTKELESQFERLKTVVAEARKAEADALVEMQAILMQSKGLSNVAAGALKDAGGDVDKALEMVADRMSD
jgi:hypothetical protein